MAATNVQTQFNRGPVSYSGGGPGSVALAAGSSRSGAVFLGGTALVLTNAAFTPQGRDIWSDIFVPRRAFKGQTPGAVHIFGQLIVVLVLTVLASLNDALGSIAIALLIAMWLVFLIQRVPASEPGAKR